MKKMNNGITWFQDPLLAWEYFNEVFLKGEEDLPFVFQKNATYLYDVVFGIINPKLPDNIDFGKLFNYSMAKWRLLVSNYLNEFIINKTKEEVVNLHRKKSSIYNYPMSFTNNHGHGKKCLLSVVFSRRCGENNPTISVYLRASEITKRLIYDFLLIQRIGEYVYGNNNFRMVFHINQMFNDNKVLLMYNAHKDIIGILKNKKDRRSKELLKDLNTLLEKPIKDIKYKIHRRVAKVLHDDVKKPVTLVKDCILPF